ncbi:MAG: hypothetical protein COT24_01105 [Candidatus Kerfeldbacteria bacterium CG08_land_8_20_14_0_20_40_16]|uniref:Methyltransferase type 11 domain-containing protein n=1 Tax=Candidatus Kerfeldbacteria bacterium CG08_land_8_20_14_0_20_40_16 TaxID=2014244 RepID=A0A2H0YWT7_9BACT|nr:MAG: hypothetical protein COT24_01105 [Candidatus Kerfeldbacteria bacterium CG08_land_8_20_14_0_20_40_16]
MKNKPIDKFKCSWLESNPKFTKNSLLIKNYQVMQKWEDDYMKELASVVTLKGGDVLEVGFGLGISAGYIQNSRRVHRHTIIEAHPQVVKYAISLFNKQLRSGRMNILQGFWEDILLYFKDKQFDGILFDTSPITKEKLFFHYFPFFKEAHRLLKKGEIGV